MRQPNLLSAAKVKLIKEEVLGKPYELSLVFISSKKSRELNRIYRGKDKSTNVLSFPLSKTSGEIFIDTATAKTEYKDFGLDFKNFVLYLFIHGVLHLSGLDHGSTMEKREKLLLKKFKFNGSALRSRHRHRHLTNKSGNRRGSSR